MEEAPVVLTRAQAQSMLKLCDTLSRTIKSAMKQASSSETVHIPAKAEPLEVPMHDDAKAHRRSSMPVKAKAKVSPVDDDEFDGRQPDSRVEKKKAEETRAPRGPQLGQLSMSARIGLSAVSSQSVVFGVRKSSFSKKQQQQAAPKKKEEKERTVKKEKRFKEEEVEQSNVEPDSDMCYYAASSEWCEQSPIKEWVWMTSRNASPKARQVCARCSDRLKRSKGVSWDVAEPFDEELYGEGSW